MLDISIIVEIQEKRIGKDAGRYEVRRYAFGHGNGAAAADHAPVALGSSRGDGRRRNRRGTGDPKLHAFAPSGKAEERGPGIGRTRRYLPALSREHGRPSGTPGIYLRGMLHTEKSD